MSLADAWHYTDTDPALMLFSAALKAWRLPILPGQSVLELGCNESLALPLLNKADPTLKLTGVDWRPNDKEAPGHGADGYTFVQGCAWDQSLFPAASFDWVLLLGALEHFGLGYYGDPKDSDGAGGDTRTMQAVQRWLKPGGHVYFDVPCNPEAAVTSHFRTYEATDILTVQGLDEVARGWSLPEPDAGTWIPQPVIHRVPYYFLVEWLRKPC